MMQSRVMSLIEAIANIVVGYGLAVATQILIFPVFGLQATIAQSLTIGAIFTIMSIVRSFVLRRVFEAHRSRTATSAAAKPAVAGASSRRRVFVGVGRR